jgi:hypothetical protein
MSFLSIHLISISCYPTAAYSGRVQHLRLVFQSIWRNLPYVRLPINEINTILNIFSVFAILKLQLFIKFFVGKHLFAVGVVSHNLASA